jgi:hypothetical protein
VLVPFSETVFLQSLSRNGAGQISARPHYLIDQPTVCRTHNVNAKWRSHGLAWAAVFSFRKGELCERFLDLLARQIIWKKLASRDCYGL